MIAGGTDLGGLCADSDVAAVAAFPDLDFALFEHLRCLQIVQQCAVALFVVLFDLRDEAEALCQLREALFLGSLGKVLIHIRPFVVFACGGSGQIGLRVADAGQLLEFVGGDVVASYDMFDKVVDAYNQDAKYIDMLIGDFSATSEELLASIDGVLSSMDGIATATNEGAKGTTDIAQKTIDVKTEADSVTAEVERCDETAKKLMEEIGVFKI